jgi:hypothetical protein
MVGQTDSNGLIQCVCAATSEVPGDANKSGSGNDGTPGQDDNGVTDSNGNLLCKSYA